MLGALAVIGPYGEKDGWAARHVLHANVDRDDHQHATHRRPQSTVRPDGLYRAADIQGHGS